MAGTCYFVRRFKGDGSGTDDLRFYDREAARKAAKWWQDLCYGNHAVIESLCEDHEAEDVEFKHQTTRE